VNKEARRAIEKDPLLSGAIKQFGLTFPPSLDSEAPRLSKQCAAILERLRLGPASNGELASIALKYTGRISDLRAAGFSIKVTEHNRHSGYVVYALERAA
jgi:hypothetical protein